MVMLATVVTVVAVAWAGGANGELQNDIGSESIRAAGTVGLMLGAIRIYSRFYTCLAVGGCCPAHFAGQRTYPEKPCVAAPTDSE